MKKRTVICSVLILLLILVSAVPSFAQQARATASILIIISPREDELKDKGTEKVKDELSKKIAFANQDTDSVEKE